MVSGRSFIRVVSSWSQCGLLSGWSVIMVVSQQGGRHHDGLGVVFHRGGLSSWWSLNRVVRHHNGFSVVSLEGFQCIHHIPLIPLLFIRFSPGCCGECACLLQVFPKPPPSPVQFERQQSWNRDQQRMVKYRVGKHTKTANSDWIGLYRVSHCWPSTMSSSTHTKLQLQVHWPGQGKSCMVNYSVNRRT